MLLVYIGIVGRRSECLLLVVLYSGFAVYRPHFVAFHHIECGAQRALLSAVPSRRQKTSLNFIPSVGQILIAAHHVHANGHYVIATTVSPATVVSAQRSAVLQFNG